MNEDQVAALERERLIGMPRWEIRPERYMLITGSRHWADRIRLYRACMEEYSKLALDDRGVPRSVILRHGACPPRKLEGDLEQWGGADYMANQWAKEFGVQTDPHPALWDDYGDSAGPIRNSKMVDLGNDVCLCFPLKGSKGTRNCVVKALDAGIPVRNYGTVSIYGIEPIEFEEEDDHE